MKTIDLRLVPVFLSVWGTALASQVYSLDASYPLLISIAVGALMVFWQVYQEKARGRHRGGEYSSLRLLIGLLLLSSLLMQMVIWQHNRHQAAQPFQKLLLGGVRVVEIEGEIIYPPQPSTGLAKTVKTVACKRSGRIQVSLHRLRIGEVEQAGGEQEVLIKQVCLANLRQGQLIASRIRLSGESSVAGRKDLSEVTVSQPSQSLQLSAAQLQTLPVAYANGPIKILNPPAGFARIHNTLLDGLDYYDYPQSSAAKRLLPALLLGDRAGLLDPEIDALRGAGLLHLVCISGMHLGILVTMSAAVLRGSAVGLRIAVQVLLIIVFLALIGPVPSALRASLMALIAVNAPLVGKRAQSLNSLCLAATAMLIYKPAQAWQWGFILSVLSTAAIICAAGWISDIGTAVNRWVQQLKIRYFLPQLSGGAAQILATSLVAQLATAPVISSVQGRIYPLAPLANLLVIPVIPVLIVGGIVALILEVSGFWGSDFIIVVLNYPARYLLNVAKLFGADSYLSLAWPEGWIGSILLIAIIGGVGYIYLVSCARILAD